MPECVQMQSLVEGEFANSVLKKPKQTQKLNILQLTGFFPLSFPFPKVPPWQQESLELEVG